MEVGIVKIFYITPKATIRKPAFGKETVDVWIPFKRPSESMKDADEPRDKVFGLVQGEKKLFDDIRNRLEGAVEQIALFKEKMEKGIIVFRW